MSLPEGSPILPFLSLQTTVEGGIQETTEAERSPRTSPQPPPVRATARASTSRDSREHRHRKVTGERATLHNLAPPRHLHPAVPPLSRPRWEVRRRRAGRQGGTLGTRRRPPHRTELGVGTEARALSPGMRGGRGGRGGRRRTQPGRARGGPGAGRGPHAARRLQASSAPLAAPPGTAPRSTCHAPYLRGFMELLLEPGHRHGAGGRAGGAGCGKKAAAERGRRAEPGGALAGPPLVVPPPGLWARGRGAARDAGSCGETP